MRKFKPIFITFTENLIAYYQNQENLQQLTDESNKIICQIDDLTGEVSQHYSTLLSNGEQEPISFEEFTADVSVPQLGKIELGDDFHGYFSDLDKQFAQWNKKEVNQDGKV